MSDTLGMRKAAVTLPEQVTAAVQEANAADLPDLVPSGVAVCGMGGSGVAGDVLAGVGADSLVVPVELVKGYELPACVTPGWLVMAVSFSGDTEEVLSATQQALERGIDVVAVTAGGSLEAIVAGAGGTVIRATADVPKPRAAIAALSVPLLVVADRMGLVPEDAFDFTAAADQAARRRDQCLAPDGPSAALVQAIGDRVPLFHGASPVGSVAAYRAKCDWNENAKRHAFAHSQPEACHNEICALEGDDRFVLVDLRTGLEHSQISRRMDILAGMAPRRTSVRAEGQGALARLLDLVTVTQLASIDAALAAGVDPGPITAIDGLKDQL